MAYLRIKHKSRKLLDPNNFTAKAKKLNEVHPEKDDVLVYVKSEVAPFDTFRKIGKESKKVP